MAERQLFSLQAWPTVNKEKESLKYLISRINDQKGSFRNVTEESLEQELREASGGITTLQADKDGADPMEDEDPKARREEVYKVREEILKQVASVFNTSPILIRVGINNFTDKPIKKAPPPLISCPSSYPSMLLALPA